MSNFLEEDEDFFANLSGELDGLNIQTGLPVVTGSRQEEAQYMPSGTVINFRENVISDTIIQAEGQAIVIFWREITGNIRLETVDGTGVKTFWQENGQQYFGPTLLRDICLEEPTVLPCFILEEGQSMYLSNITVHSEVIDGAAEMIGLSDHGDFEVDL